jgi:hypothetical protein
VLATFRALADTGRTIVAVTHSLLALTLCDRVLFLAPGGAVAFYGTPSEAADYFDWDEPASVFAALTAASAAQWKDRFRDHRAATPAGRAGSAPWRPGRPEPAPAGPAPRSSRSTPAAAASSGGAWAAVSPPPPHNPPAGHDGGHDGHLTTLLRRSRDTARADGRTLLLSLVAGPVLGVLLWAVLPAGTLALPVGPDGHAPGSSPSAQSFGFFLAMAITWLGAAGAVREVVKDRHILRRERAVGVSSEAFLTAKALCLAAVASAQALPLGFVALQNQHLPARGAALGSGVVEVLVVSVLVGLTAVSTGLLVSAWASSSEKALATLPVVLVAEMALAGPWASHTNVAISTLRAAVPARWASAAIDASVVGDGGAWFLAVLGLAVLFVVQLGAALWLVKRAMPSMAAARRPAGSPQALAPRPAAPSLVPAAPRWRQLADRPSRVRVAACGLAVAVTLSVGILALARAGTGGNTAALVVSPSPAAPAPTAAASVPSVAPTTLSPLPVPSPTTAVIVTAPTAVSRPPGATPATAGPSPSPAPPQAVAAPATSAAPAAMPVPPPATTPTTRATTPTTVAIGSPTWWWQQFTQAPPKK